MYFLYERISRFTFLYKYVSGWKYIFCGSLDKIKKYISKDAEWNYCFKNKVSKLTVNKDLFAQTYDEFSIAKYLIYDSSKSIVIFNQDLYIKERSAYSFYNSWHKIKERKGKYRIKKILSDIKNPENKEFIRKKSFDKYDNYYNEYKKHSKCWKDQKKVEKQWLKK